MSRRRSRPTRGLAAAVVAGAALVAQPAQAAEPYAEPVVHKVMPIVIVSPDGTATVRAHYTCYGGPGGHLYIGVKQGPQVNATTNTSSQFADTFYSTNYASDSLDLSLVCDGKQHTQSFVLAPDPWFAMARPDAPLMKTGPVFVQFCIFDATSNGDEQDPTGFGMDYSMKRAQLTG